MNKTLKIFTNELVNTVTRPSFIISLLIFPVILAVLIFVTSSQGNSTPSPAITALTGQSDKIKEGFVDHSDLIQALPPDVDENSLLAYLDTDSANQDLIEGVISGYYEVPENYIDTGVINYVRVDYNPLSGLENTPLFSEVLLYNMLGQDREKTDRYWDPIQVKEVALEESINKDVTNPMTYMIPYFIGLILYVVIISSASLLLNNITTEKQTRVIELLMSSSSPLQIMNGKIMALGIVGLFQSLLWAGSSLIVLDIFNQQSQITDLIQLPLTLIIWVVIYFLFGYAIYAALMAGVGAMVPSMKEASQATMLVVMPLLLPLILSPSFSMSPDNTLSVILSLIPFTAPVSMITRLASGPVPAWQLVVSVILMAVTAFVIIRAVAGMFRAQSILTGQSFKLMLFFKALVGKA